MKRRIFTFGDYINEQEKSKEKGKENSTGGMLAGFIEDAISTMVQNKDFSETAETEETKGGLPYSGCGSMGYTFKPAELTNQAAMDLFKEPGGYFSKDVKYVNLSKQITSGSKDLFILGVREDLEIKKREGDRFTDKIILVDPSKPTEVAASYQATTSPSVAFYSDPSRSMSKKGVAIMQPGIVEYKIGIHKKGSPTQHEALLQSGPMEIQRFDLKTPTVSTYRPGQAETGAEFGINLHRSSKDRGVCVGPYSAGCQVFADGKDFEAFMAKLKSSAQSKFLYALIENDELSSPAAPAPPPGATGAEADEEKEDNTEGLKSTADKIREDLEKTNSDEEGLIKWYNSSVSSNEDAKKIAAIYQEKFKVNIFTDLKRALNDKEFAQLNHVF
jgi:hypothetical protein